MLLEGDRYSQSVNCGQIALVDVPTACARRMPIAATVTGGEKAGALRLSRDAELQEAIDHRVELLGYEQLQEVARADGLAVHKVRHQFAR